MTIATQIHDLLHTLRRTALRKDLVGLNDGDLLGRFVANRDAAAFEELVRLDGPMVLGVCRRILQNQADAEDAFQASFLVLARKAGSIRPRSKVGNWLYGVARNAALKAKAMMNQRRIKEREAAEASRLAASDDSLFEFQDVLDEELARLPEKYRAVVVLCELEGRSVRSVANQLGLPQGTVASRLSRGRSLLRQRLVRRGVMLPSAGLAVALSCAAVSARVPPILVSSTVKAALTGAAGQAATGLISANVAAIAEGVMKSMFLTKLKVAAVMVLVLGLFAGGGLLVTFPNGAKGIPLVASASAASPGAAEPKPVPPKQFESLHKMIKPQPGENRFWEIPWQLDLWKARQMAAAQGKPILVWSGSGGPPIGNC